MTIVRVRYCSITLEIGQDAIEAGYRAQCPNCGRLFRDAEDWAASVCAPQDVPVVEPGA